FVVGLFAVTVSAQSTQDCNTCTTQTQAVQPAPQPAPTCAACPPVSALPRTDTGTPVSAELYINAGGVWPQGMGSDFNDNKIRAQGIYGLKGGLIWGGNAELEASLGYMNHFEPRNSPNPLDFNTNGTFGQPSVMGFLYDINGAWNFGNRNVFGARISPYLVVGGGGLTTEVRHGTSAFFQGGGMVPDVNGNLVANPGPTKIIHDGDTFFTVNYGGGIKAMNLWGPVGLRVDVRGRTIPNFFHTAQTWPEATGGLLLSWGER
ncbi:MAG TPA: hypothetical protein VKY31_02445, partial [Terriglobia bacterium]|nr:hypothetical protein [Terriglobia bacterium]